MSRRYAEISNRGEWFSLDDVGEALRSNGEVLRYDPDDVEVPLDDALDALRAYEQSGGKVRVGDFAVEQDVEFGQRNMVIVHIEGKTRHTNVDPLIALLRTARVNNR